MPIYYVDSNVPDTYPYSATPDFTTYNHLTFEPGGGSDLVYKTIADINVCSFNPGDQILFRKGCVWREQLEITSSGSEDNPIIFGSYGVGDNPTINGANIITSWIEYNTNIWQSTLTTEPSQIYFNETHGTNVSSILLCDGVNKWYWTSNILYVYSTSNPNTAYTNPGIEASVRTNIITVNNRNNIIIQNITIKYSKISTIGSIYINNGTNIIIDSIIVNDNDGFAGIYIEGNGNNSIIKNSIIYNTRHTISDRGVGILIDGNGGYHTVQNCEVHSNTGAGISSGLYTVSNNGIILGNRCYLNGGAGIEVKGSVSAQPNNWIIQNNEIYSNGQLIADIYGIDMFRIGNNNTVRYNLVHDGHFISISAGGIRFDGGSEAMPHPTIGSGNKIYYNIIYNEYNGISNYRTPLGSEIYNNLIYNSTHYGVSIGDEYTNLVSFKNNIIHTSKVLLIYHNLTTNPDIDYNNYYDIDYTNKFYWNELRYSTFNEWKEVSSQDSNSINSDPLFINIIEKDYHLLINSPCINKGTNIGLGFDYDGNSILNTPDIGVYEYNSGECPQIIVNFIIS